MNLIPFSVSLANGEIIRVREVGPDDSHLLETGFERLSNQSRRFRFLAAHPRLTQSEIERFTAVNDIDHVAIGAVNESGPQVQPLGIARYIRLKEHGEIAEFAITVVDDHHGLGLGSLLLGVLAKHAILNGICHFSALVDDDNQRMLNMLDQIGGQRKAAGEHETEVTLTLSQKAKDYPSSDVQEALSTAYDLAQFE